MIKITELNPVYSRIEGDEGLIRNWLQYPRYYYKQKKYKKERVNYSSPLVKGKENIFYTGFVSRIKDYLKLRELEVECSMIDYEQETISPKLEGIKFRDDQLEALSSMVKAKRGVWKAPTGSGKTIIISGLVSAFCYDRALVLVHTKDLLMQTKYELERFFPDVGIIGDGRNEPEDITVATVQTLSNMDLKEFGKQWGLLIVDEVHHVRKFGGVWDKVLSKIYAPARFGLTATLPEDKEGILTMEGLIGPIIGKTSYEELQDNDILAKPKLKLIWVPERSTDNLKGRYGDSYDKDGNLVPGVYYHGIVKNRTRNDLIVKTTEEFISKDLTVLVMVERLEHGEELFKMTEAIMPGKFMFLHGDTPAKIREEQRRVFEDKECSGIIATRVWSEGINVKSIGAVINAVGGESEIAALQRFGRGMRKTEGKDVIWLVDFLDCNHRWFQKHSMKRLCMYFEQGWI